MEIITFFAVRLGGFEKKGVLYPPTLDDVLSSSKSMRCLRGCVGALVYTVRCKRDGNNLIFVSANLDRSKLIPTGEEKRYFRAYRTFRGSFLPNEPLWQHAEHDFKNGGAFLAARSWFRSDRSKPTYLVEEVYIGNLLVFARTRNLRGSDAESADEKRPAHPRSRRLTTKVKLRKAQPGRRRRRHNKAVQRV